MFYRQLTINYKLKVFKFKVIHSFVPFLKNNLLLTKERKFTCEEKIAPSPTWISNGPSLK